MYMHPDIKPLDKELQQHRYEHYEEKRKKRIQLIKDKRQELIEKDNMNAKTNRVINLFLFLFLVSRK